MFDHLLFERGIILQDQIKILEEVADNIDKEVKIAGIIGATAGALGLVAGLGSVKFVPFSRAASWAVGAIVVVGAAAVGVSATIINKIHTRKNVEKKLETVFNVHSMYVEEVERCVKFIGSNAKCLKKYDLSTLKWVRVTRVVQVAGDSVGAIGPLSKSSGLIQGFRLGMGIFSIKDDSEQLKKDTETKFAKQIRMLAKQMQGSLDDLMKFKNIVDSVDV